MEVAKINWEDSKFENSKDDIYEHINAPQWIDFHSPDDNDDVARFCRSGKYTCECPARFEGCEALAGSYTLKRIRKDSCQCRHSYVGVWGFHFNSIPGSAPHALLALGKVDPMHPDLAVDPLRILRPAAKLSHTLPLGTINY